MKRIFVVVAAIGSCLAIGAARHRKHRKAPEVRAVKEEVHTYPANQCVLSTNGDTHWVLCREQKVSWK